MDSVQQYPMARILFPFIGGILFASLLPIANVFSLISISLVFLMLVLWIFTSRKYISYRTRWLGGLLIALFFFFLGIIGFSYNSPLNRKSHYAHFKDVKAYLIEIKDPITETPKTFKTIGLIKQVYEEKDSEWKIASGRVLVYFQKTENFQLQYGDQFISTSNLIRINGAQNPNAFDYSLYMSRKGIFDQSFIKENEWKLVKSNKAITLPYLAIKLRSKLLDILNSLNYDQESLALAAALLIGYDEYLNDDLRARFQGSGAMHILCVSGLHVGIIFMIFNFLFGFFDKIKYGASFKTILILIIIWFYALITGLSPAVVRASTMFTFIIIGELFNRKGNTYNSLAASALLLLIIDPYLIYNIGFQLSYGAVFAILYIQPKIYQLYHFKNIILNKIWALIAVSLAAQLGTFPLVIYYFHQFPNYFLLTNLWVIPVAFIVITAGIIVLTIAIFGLSSSIIGIFASNIFKYSLLGLNKGVEIINLLPHAVTDNLTFSQIEVFLLYAFLFSVSAHILYKKYFWLFPSLIFILLLSISFNNSKTNNLKSEVWVVYKTSRFSAMDFIYQQKSVLFGDSVFVSDKNVQKFISKENQIKLGVKSFVSMPNKMDKSLAFLKIQENVILFNKLRILYLDKLDKDKIYANPLPVDYVVLAKDVNVKLPELLRQYTFNYIIFDSSNNWWIVKNIKEDADKLGIEYWDVNEQGAFVFSNKKFSEKFKGV